MSSTLVTPRSLGDTDAPHVSPVTPSEDVRTVLINHISWGAVIAGVVMALVIHFLLNLLGAGIGSATIDPATGDTPSAKTLSLSAAIWWTFSGLIASFVGGLTAGRLSGRPKESTTAWHGLIAWGLTTLIVTFLIASAVGTVVSGTVKTIGGAAAGAGQAAVEAAAPAMANAGDPFAAIEQRVREATGGNDPEVLRETATSAMRALVSGDPAEADAARERAADALARAQNISPDEARKQVAEYEAQYRRSVEQAKQKAREAADATAKATALATIVAFFALVLGAFAGWLGGRAGAVDPTITAGPMARRV